MMSVLRSPQTAWILAGLAILALSVTFIGGFGTPTRPTGPETYESAALRLAAARGGPALKMKFDVQSPGPLRDTVIQRWHDPVDGSVCYIYLPVAVPHSAGPRGLVQYGQAAIGSVSCFPSPKG